MGIARAGCVRFGMNDDQQNNGTSEGDSCESVFIDGQMGYINKIGSLIWPLDAN